MSARCVAHDLHTIAPRPLERTCWRQFIAQRGDCNNLNKSRIAPFDTIIIIIIRHVHANMVGWAINTNNKLTHANMDNAQTIYTYTNY